MDRQRRRSASSRLSRGFSPLLPGAALRFTLIELLVVIAIIAVLCALLFPALSGTKEKVNQVACRSNLRQIGMMTFHYSVDYNGWLLPYNWAGKLISCYSFGANMKVYKCPSERLQAVTNTAEVHYGACLHYILETFSYAWSLDYPMIKLSDIERSGRLSSTVLLLDSQDMGGGGSYYVMHSTGNWRVNWAQGRHGQSMGVVWTDMHVSQPRTSKLADSNGDGVDDSGYFDWHAAAPATTF